MKHIDKPAPDTETPRFSSQSDGLYLHDGAAERKICSPLRKIGMSTDEEGKHPAHVLKMKPLVGVARLFELPCTAAAHPVRTEELLTEAGVTVLPGCRHSVLDYIRGTHPDQLFLRTEREGWLSMDGTLHAYVMGKVMIGPTDEQRQIFRTLPASRFAQAGAPGDWVALSRLCRHNPLMILALCAAFSSALLRPLGLDAGFVMFFGRSSTGKTTLLRLANALFTSPDRLGTWAGTANGIEARALQHADMPMTMDEIDQADPAVLGNLGYGLTNGASKQRANADGSAASVARVQTMILSSGETHAVDWLRAAGKDVKLGQQARFLSIPVNEAYGVFADLHGEADGAAFVRRIESLMRRVHGHAWPVYVRFLVENLATLERRFLKSRDELVSRVAGGIVIDAADGVVARVLERFVAMAFAGLTAVASGAVDWTRDDVLSAMHHAFRLWHHEFSRQRQSPDAALIEDLRYFLRTHRHRMPSAADYRDQGTSTPYGFTWHSKRGEDVFLLFPEFVLKRFGQGVKRAEMDRALRESGYLIAADRPTKQIRMPNMPEVRMSFYMIRQSILSE